MASHSGPSARWKMAWQKACQSASTCGGSPSLVSHVPGVDEGAQPTSSGARRVSSSAPSRLTSRGTVCRKLWGHHFLGPRFSMQGSHPHSIVFVHLNQLSEPVHNTAATFVQQNLLQSSQLDCRHLSAGLSSKSFSLLIKLSHIPCGAACAGNTFAS